MGPQHGSRLKAPIVADTGCRSTIRPKRSWAMAIAGVLLSLGLSFGTVAPATAVVHQADRADRPHADSWWSKIMKLDQVHRQATGRGVTVAVLDGGLQLDVRALEGADITMMKSPCLDGQRAKRAPGPRQQHGSIMTSLIAGSGNGPTGPGSGVRGVAPDARVLFYDIDDQRDPKPDSSLNCYEEPVIRTVLAALDAGADVVSMSFAVNVEVGASGLLREAVARNDAVIVMASPRKGEGGPENKDVLDLSAVPGVVSVNALDRNYDPWVKSLTFWDKDKGKESTTPQWYSPVVSAPGVDIEIPGAAENFVAGARTTGTSAATALVAGSIAVVKEKYPDATGNQLIQGLVHHTTRENQTGKDKASDMLWALNTGYGPVSPLNMLKHDPAGWPDENPLLGTPVTMSKRYPSSMEGTRPSTSSSPDKEAKSEPDDASVTTEPAGTSAWVWVFGAVIILLALAGALLLTVRRRHSTGRPPESTQAANDDEFQQAGDTDEGTI